MPSWSKQTLNFKINQGVFDSFIVKVDYLQNPPEYKGVFEIKPC